MEQQPHTEPTTPSRVSPPAGAIVAGIGGLLTLVGVFLHWARLTSTLEGGQFAGQQFGPASQSVGATGISHWTGILALVAGLVAVAAAIAIVVLQDPGTRRMAAMAAAGGGTLALLMAILGIVMSESIALGDVPGGKQALDFARQFAEQLGVEGFGIDTGPAMGVFVTAMGGALAAGGGFIALRGGPVVVGRAQEPPPAGTGFEAPSRPPGPQPTVPPEPPSATGPGGPSQAGGETTPEPPPGDAKKSGETTA